MKLEFDTLLHNCIRYTVPFNRAQKFISCKWVFQIKHHDDDSIELYKARFVAKLFHQQPDLDSNETSSPNAKPIKIRTFSLLMCLYIYISFIFNFNYAPSQKKKKKLRLCSNLRSLVVKNIMGWYMQQIDVQNAFLQSQLSEVVYVSSFGIHPSMISTLYL